MLQFDDEVGAIEAVKNAYGNSIGDYVSDAVKIQLNKI